MKFIFTVLAVLPFFLSCATPSTRNVASENSGKNAAKNPEVLGADLLDFELMPEESWEGGSREAELDSLMKLSQKIKDLEKEVEAEVPRTGSGFDEHNRSGRVAHDKTHGCLTGTLKILAERPGDPQGLTFQGIFAKKNFTYQIISRFTNGTGVRENDAKPSLRGMSIKVFTEDGRTVDLTAANSDTAVGRNFSQSFDVIAANLRSPKDLIEFLINAHKEQVSRPDEIDYRYVIFRTLAKVSSVTQEKYWSGNPYALGPNHYMKFMFQPEGWTDQNQFSYEHQGDIKSDADFAWKVAEQMFKTVQASPNYLREDLAKRAQAGPIKFTVFMQLFKDKRSTPIEDTLVVWNEKLAQPIPVAEITFEPQTPDVPERDMSCDGMRFTPGHYDPALRPVGNTGRGRIFGYLANAQARNSPPAEPDVSIVEKWRHGDY